MTKQEIFNTLADNEERLFYALCADRDNKDLIEAHKAAKMSLERFAKDTGCCNL